MGTARNLLNLKDVEKGYGSRSVLREITLGVQGGERIGVVGRNGGGKSTLLALIAGVEQPDAGRITRAGDVGVALLSQQDELEPHTTLGAALLGKRVEHEWAADRAFRGVLDGLLGGVGLERFPAGMDTRVAGLSGGERRRIALARLLLDPPELLLLDEPTNHLDVEAVDWLASHLAQRRGSMLVVTHDRWFLDAVCTATWEVTDGAVHQYEGGYAAYVLARAERERQESAKESRRRQLIRKELAWLRRGPPARTTKPKFRIEAANALIADEPPARDRAELLRFASSRLGDKVLHAEDVSLALGGREVLHGLTWRLGPGERVALVGVNGSGKTSLVKLLAGELQPSSGVLERGATVRTAHLSQETVEISGELRVLESLQEARSHAVLSDGREITASLLCDRFGFRGDKSRTLVRDLSGGERRRLGLMRLLMGEPNVLLLDEPTNDLDIDTLTALEDLLDGWPGTLVIVSHDRYFVERVCDDVYAITATGGIRHVPGGIDQYLRERHASEGRLAASSRQPSSRQPSSRQPSSRQPASLQAEPSQAESSQAEPSQTAPSRQPASPQAASSPPERPLSPGAAARAARKDARREELEGKRLERSIEKLAERERGLMDEMRASPTDYARLAELQAELERTAADRERLEAAWLELSESLESR